MEKLNIVSRKLVENGLCVYYHFRHFLLLEIKKKKCWNIISLFSTLLKVYRDCAEDYKKVFPSR